VNGVTSYNVYDGWDLIEEYQAGGTVTAKYVQGPGGPIKELVNNRYYYQDGSGSTSHLADSNGDLLEWYRYDLDGTPIVNDQPTNHSSAFGVRHLFNGQQWYSEVGLYDLRNRFYSPDIGRFLQPDPTGFEGDATNLYRYCGNNPVTRSDPSGNRAVPDPRGWYTYVVNPGWGQYVWTPGYVPGSNGWCAAGTQILSGGWSGGAYHDVPKTDYWFQGASLTSATRMGTVVAKGWQDGGYPGLSPGAYVEAYPGASDVNHAGIFLFVDAKGKAVILDQYQGKILGLTSVSPNDQWKWNEVYVDKGDGPYASGTSGDPNGRGGVVVSAPPLSKNEQAKLRGLFRLAMMNNPYWGYLPTTNTTNWAGGIAGLPSGGSPWDLDNQQGGVDPFANVGSTWGEGFRPADEPGMGPGCFVAGTPVLMADGSEKSIESIQVGEAVLAWNEETKQMFSTNVVSALHHEEKMQTLFDIDLEDGRKFTVNNDHPMYVVEDSDFKFTDDLAARFAKGEPITFQGSKNEAVKIASLRIRKEICKVYNLHVEGQGKKGHTYYANGILVHNIGAGNKFK
jgi:RHS repeat-associated protein